MPSGYLMLWQNAFQLVQGRHLRVADVLQCVDLIAWDNQHLGMGYRAQRRGDYLVILQKPPIKAKATWRDHGIPDRWVEKVDRKLHPHIKPIGLISRLIGAVTVLGDLVVDPAAGSFAVMHAAHQLGREFVGCDLAFTLFPADRTASTATAAAIAVTAEIAQTSSNHALAEHATEIRRLHKRAIADVIEIGRHLAEAKIIIGSEIGAFTRGGTSGSRPHMISSRAASRLRAHHTEVVEPAPVSAATWASVALWPRNRLTHVLPHRSRSGVSAARSDLHPQARRRHG
jgi:hypothetical protein